MYGQSVVPGIRQGLLHKADGKQFGIAQTRIDKANLPEGG